MSRREASTKLQFRSLLTETLPFEGPTVFTNEIFYANQVRPSKFPKVASALRELRDNDIGRPKSPYVFFARKDRTRGQSLSILHPSTQLSICDFYESFNQLILSHCARSKFSIRYPTKISPVATPEEIDAIPSPKTGTPQQEDLHGEVDVSRLTSYFQYKKYSLLYRFFESRDYIELEKRFSWSRQLDVSKCFHSIYTHSITWASKGKQLGKSRRNHLSFESRLDHVMQEASDRETKGIPVGPEFSRIFAEIILQRIDESIETSLNKKLMEAEKTYAIRRYVDDYFIFAHTEEALNRIENSIRASLEEYKLHLNDEKTETLRRPFVTKQTLAKRDIRLHIQKLNACISDLVVQGQEIIERNKHEKKLRKALDKAISSGENPPAVSSPVQQVSAAPVEAFSIKKKDQDLRKSLSSLTYQSLEDLRLAVIRYDVGFNHISPWILGQLRKSISILLSQVRKITSDDHMETAITLVRNLISLVFYLCSLDLRVRTTYILNQVIYAACGTGNAPTKFRASLSADVLSELVTLTETTTMRSVDDDGGRGECIELYNLLICGSACFGSDFTQLKAIEDTLRTTVVDLSTGRRPLTYFTYIAIKFTLLRDPVTYKKELSELNRLTVDRLKQATPAEILSDSELSLLLSDFISAPDVKPKAKSDALARVSKISLNAAELRDLVARIGFVDWTNLRLDHLLRRKQLQPAYG